MNIIFFLACCLYLLDDIETSERRAKEQTLHSFEARLERPA
jgi:hypothetical protein